MPDLLLDYDVIGFDADHSLVKYDVVEFAKLVTRSFLEDMHAIYGYPKEITEFDYENNLGTHLNNAVWDI